MRTLEARALQVRGLAEHRAACAEFRRRRAADEQARVDALLLELVDALAGAMDAHSANECPECSRALGTRNRTCPHCRAIGAVA